MKRKLYIYSFQLPATRNQIIIFFIASYILFLHILLLYTACCKQFQIFCGKSIKKLKGINRYRRQKETEEKCLSVVNKSEELNSQETGIVFFSWRACLVRRAVPPADKILNDLPFKVSESDQATDSSKLHNWMKSKPQRYGFSSKTKTIPYLSHFRPSLLPQINRRQRPFTFTKQLHLTRALQRQIALSEVECEAQVLETYHSGLLLGVSQASCSIPRTKRNRMTGHSGHSRKDRYLIYLLKRPHK